MGLAYLRHEVSENTGKHFPVSGKKSRSESRTMPGKNGGTLKVGGTNPGAGRPPDAFKARMQVLLDRMDVEKYLAECLQFMHGENAYFKALEFTAERGEGKVPSVTKIEGGDEPLKIIVEHATKPSDG